VTVRNDVPALLWRMVSVLTDSISGYLANVNGSRASRRNGSLSQVT
jgi:hypothetical protein